MAEPLPIRGLTEWLIHVAGGMQAGADAAMLEAVEIAYRGSVLNAKENFNNTPGRTRSGQIMNAISRGYDPSTRQGWVSSKLAYAAIQEYGGTVHPKVAKHLWVKNYVGVDSQFKRLTPREFMAKKAADPRHFVLFQDPRTKHLVAAYRAGGVGRAQMQALFSLVDKVTLPARPYIRPAVEAASKALGELLTKRMAEAIK